jgi:heme/copper-type cytochrome/quinol oxidase subunit 2
VIALVLALSVAAGTWGPGGEAAERREAPGAAHPDSLRVGLAGADTVEVVASEKGFEPRVINLRKGDPVRLRLTSADREHCFAVDAFRVEKRIRPGQATLLDLTPEKAGTFPFQCCVEEGAAAEKEHGRLVVIE